MGQDRLVGGYAALCLYGRGAHRRRSGARHPERARQREPRETGRDVIVCDFGTAVTIDVVSRRGEYLGGVIAPGLELSLETLAHRTALLPRVSLKAPPSLLGRDTAASIRSGIVYGAAALCDGLISRLKARYAPNAVVVATGGSAHLLARYARSLTRVRPHLVLEGLCLLSGRGCLDSA